VVDDEPDARELIRFVLEGCNAEVVTAASAQALQALSRDKPHVPVSDIGMPQEDGYLLIRKREHFLLSKAEGYRRWRYRHARAESNAPFCPATRCISQSLLNLLSLLLLSQVLQVYSE